MSFSFDKIKETDRLKDVYPKINEIGEELSKPNSIYKQLNDLKTTVSKYQTYKLTTDTGQYTSGQVINLDTVQGSKTMYGTITNPPKGLSGEGWVEYKESENGESALVTLNPLDSENTYRKIRKLPKQEQNPNLLRDTIFTYVPARLGQFSTRLYWDRNNTPMTVRGGTQYQGLNTIRMQDKDTTYPQARHKGIEVGNEVKVGDKVTLSAYYYVPDVSSLKDNHLYIEIAGYNDELSEVNKSINSTIINKEDIIENEWVKVSTTATIPSTIEDKPIKYISALLRINTSKSGRGNGFVVYYALPKLELGDKVTPYVSHPDDKLKFNELWSEWKESKNTQELDKYSPIDTLNNGYLTYEWTSQASGGMTFSELIDTVPQGLHTFYLNANVKGAPSKKNIRGTILVNHYASDPTKLDNVRATISCVDEDGVSYSLYKVGDTITPILKSVGSYELWTGTQDLSNTSYIFNLNDSVYNYDYIEIDYYTYSDTFMDNKRSRIYAETDTITLNTTRLASSTETNSGFDFWQAQIKIINSNQMEPYYSKRVSVNSSSLSTVSGRNTPGLFTIKKIIGIKG